MHYSFNKPADARDTSFSLDGRVIPNLKDCVPLVFLGKYLGSFAPKETATSGNHLEFVDKILHSMFAPWQRIDYLKTFFPFLR